MVWDIIMFCFTVAGTTAVCWWFWKGTDKEKAALKDEVARLRARLTEKM